MKTTIDLKESLSKYNESNYSLQEDLLLKEVQKIIVNNEEEDLLALRKAGFNSNLNKSINIDKERQTEFKFKEVYDIKAIEKLAVNYGLRFLPFPLYNGTIDPALPSVIKNFIKDNNIIFKEPDQETKRFDELLDRPDDTGFYILAPKENFNLRERPKDPLLLYKINDKKYSFVYKWGDDLSILRVIRFFLVRDWYYLQILVLILGVIRYKTISEVVLNSNGLTNKDLIVMLTFVMMAIVGAIYSNFSPNNNWKNEYKD